MSWRDAAFIIGLAAVGCTTPSAPSVRPAATALEDPADGYPPARREDVSDVLHGVRVADPYRWLEDGGSEEVVTWVDAQAVYAREKLDALPGRTALRKRFEELYYLDEIYPPTHRGGRYFYSRDHSDKEKSVVYVRIGENGKERVLFDPNTMSPDGSVSLKGFSPSHNGKLVAYKLSKDNADASTMYVREVDSGRDREVDVIEGTRYGSASWTADSRGFFYIKLPSDSSIPPAEMPGRAEVRYHVIGQDPANDEVVHPATGDPTRFVNAYASRDGRYLMLMFTRGWSSTGVYFKRLDRKSTRAPGNVPEGTDPRTIAAGFQPLIVSQSARYTALPWRNRFYVHTNEGAPKYRVFKVDPRRPARKNWREIVAETDDTLQGVQVVGDHLVLTYLRNASSAMEVRDLDGKPVRQVVLPGIGSAGGMLGNPDEDEAYFFYSSFTEVPQIYKTSVATGATSLWETIDYPVDTSGFRVQQVWYPSKDGTKVSMFVVHRKDIELDGSNPTLLTGYGGFSVSRTPSFSAGAVVWLEHGGVYAVPNLRGGGEYGEQWHDAGKLHNKQNVFDDFIAAAEYLISNGYTSSGKLSIAGGSNGGLLVGAAMTQRPDLFQAVSCANPLLDMVRYHKFGSGKTWIPEYGSAEDAKQFATLHAYSPYHHVEAGAHYPALLMRSAESDDRVDPLHARKFVAAVQNASKSERPVWLRVERQAGHGGADLTRKAVDISVDTYAFLFAQLGITD